MPRPQNPDLTKNWKVCLPATLAGTVEFYLFDRLHNKPKYGARAELLSRLLSDWVMEQKEPNARVNAIANELFRVSGTLSQDQIDAIRRGLEAELAPSSSIPSSISSLA